MVADNASRFTGSIPDCYEQWLVPLLFEPYADDLAARLLQPPAPRRLLELAAGTGVLTRRLSRHLPAGATLLATDLNPAMLEVARRHAKGADVTWQVANAMQLPFGAGSFDGVVCQFGVMFFPDKQQAFGEVRHVLRPGGRWWFNVWGPLETNPLTAAVHDALGQRYGAAAPAFMAQVPHGYHDEGAITRDVTAAGFVVDGVQRVTLAARAPTPQAAAMAFCHGTPLHHDILAREPNGLDAATQWTAAALARRFGVGPIDVPMEALVVQATKPLQ